MKPNPVQTTSGQPTVISRSVSIHGPAREAADLAFRRVFKMKETNAGIVVLDYGGRGASVLDSSNRMNLHKRHLEWVDLAHRRKPVAVAQFQAGAHFDAIIADVLWAISRIACVTLLPATIQWAAALAGRQVRTGTVGLGALLRAVALPEIRRWFHETQPEPDQLEALAGVLGWALAFPSVFAVSEGPNQLDLEGLLGSGESVWLEFPSDHMEAAEHAICVALVQARLADTLLRLRDHKQVPANAHPASKPGAADLGIVHVFPQYGAAEAMPEWIGQTSGLAKHVAVHRLDPSKPPRPIERCWAAQAATLWLLPVGARLSSSVHGGWLSEHELKKLATKDEGAVVVRCNTTKENMTARRAECSIVLSDAALLRVAASKNRRGVRQRQFSSAFSDMGGQTAQGRGVYEKLCNPEFLRLGWARVSAAGSTAAGLDNVNCAAFRLRLDEELQQLSTELCAKTYRCRPLKRFTIAKPDGGERQLSLPTVRDKVVQATFALLLEPIVDPTFSPFSYAYRKGRNAHQAVAIVRAFMAGGDKWIVSTDIQSCFDSINHDLLLQALLKYISDADALGLVDEWIKADALFGGELISNEVGVPLGESISPMLANIYLDRLDKHLENLKIHFVRYADDITLICKTEEEAKMALESVSTFLSSVLQLHLKPSKTEIRSADDGFDFLGFFISANDILVGTKAVARAQKAVSEAIQSLGPMDSASLPAFKRLEALNGLIRGFRNYFLLPDEQGLLMRLWELDQHLDVLVRERLSPEWQAHPYWVTRERFCPTAGDSAQVTANDELQQLQKVVPYAKRSGAPALPAILRSDGTRPKEIPSGERQEVVRNELKRDKKVENVALYGDRLYVMEHGCYLVDKGDDLVLRKKHEEIARFPMSALGIVYMQGIGMGVSCQAQAALADRDIPVIVSSSGSIPAAVLTPVATGRASLRRLQAIRRDEPAMRDVGLRMLAAKVGNQAAVLKYFMKYRKRDERLYSNTNTVITTIHELQNRILDVRSDGCSWRATAMGFEGKAAAAYWQQVRELVPGVLGFDGRTTRGATDPMNVCLNYVYGMLYGEVWRSVVRAGLDPYFGLMHGSERDNGSLVFDIIEEFRAPMADRFVLGLLGRGFMPDVAEEGRLRGQSRLTLVRGFLRHWHKKITWRSKAVSPAEILELQVGALVRAFQGDSAYRPFKMRW